MSGKSFKKWWPSFKKNGVRVIALVLAGLMVLAVLIAALIPTYAEGTRARYAMDVQVDESARGAHVSLTVDYTNDTAFSMDAVSFQLYANAYRRQSTAPAAAFPDGFSPGGVEMLAVSFNGSPADWGVLGAAEALLRVACDLAPGQSGQFSFVYDLLLPDSLGDLGAGETDWRLEYFYPAVCAYSDSLEEFIANEYAEIGDAYLAEAADYRATVVIPDNYLLAATGAETLVAAENGFSRYEIIAEEARALSLTLGRKYREMVWQTEEGVSLRLLANERLGAKRARAYATGVLSYYIEVFGCPPCQQIDIAQSDIALSAARPGLLLLNTDLFSYANRGEMEYQIAYLLAKQYFAQLVGVNEAREAWLTEATSCYMALRYLHKAYGEDRFLRELNARVKPALNVTIPGGVHVDSVNALFSSREEWAWVVRYRGAAALHEICLALGEETFFDALRAYVENNAGRIASVADFAAALNAASGREMDYYLMEMLRDIDEYTRQEMDWYE